MEPRKGAIGNDCFRDKEVIKANFNPATRVVEGVAQALLVKLLPVCFG